MPEFFKNPLDKISRPPCDLEKPLPAAMLTSLLVANRRLREALQFSNQAIKAMKKADQRSAAGHTARAIGRCNTAQDLMDAMLIYDDETSYEHEK